MKTEELDKCLNILSCYHDPDEKKIEILAGMDTDFQQEFIEPFRRELGMNLLTKPTFQEKKDLITFYIDELDRVIIISENFKNIQPVDLITDELLAPIWYEGQYESDDEGISEVRAHYLFSLLFVVIQEYCNLYHIPFIEICDDRFFNLDVINLEPTKERAEILDFGKSIKEKHEFKLPAIRPVFASESRSEIFEILRDFFSLEDQIELLALLEGGDNAPKPLLFMDSGNRLADAFKQLFDCDIIKGCQKKELEAWICKNFRYRYRNKINRFNPRSVSDIVSTTKDKCQRPILNVKQEKSTGNFLITKV